MSNVVKGPDFAISFGIYAAVGAGLYTVFSLLRDTKKYKRFYAPKSYMPAAELDGARPPTLPPSFLGWAPTVLSFNQLQTLKYAGMDGLTMIRVLNFVLTWSMFATVLCCSVILPINLTGDGCDGCDIMSRFTTAGIAERADTLWVPAVMIWVLVAFTVWLLHKYHREAVGLRINYFASLPKGGETHTILITDIPGLLDGTYVDRAAFLVPKAKRDKLTTAVDTAAAKATTEGTGLLGKLWYMVTDALLGLTATLHNAVRKEQLPMTRYNMAGQPTYTEPPPMDDMDMPGGGVDTVSGIPLCTQISSWPRAHQALQAGASADQMVTNVFHNMFGDQFVAAHVVRDTSKLSGLVKEFENRKERFADMADGWAGRIRRGKFEKKGKVVKPMTKVVGAKYGSWGINKYGPKVATTPLVDFQLERMEELKRQILAEQKVSAGLPSSAAFVTFRSRVTQTLAANALIHHDTSSWLPKPAPPPEGIVWGNLRFRKWERSVRRLALTAAYVALILFMAIPIALLQGLINAISKVSWLEWIYDIAILGSIFQSIIPTLGLKIFIAILPPILRLMTWLEGVTSKTDIDLGLERKFFGYLYVTVFLGTMIASSLLNQISNPEAFVTSLGQAVPNNAVFFTNFLMLDALFALPFQLLAVVSLVIYAIKCALSAGERAKAKLWKNQPAEYGTNVGNAMLGVLLIFVFSPVFPIMAPFGVLWAVSSLVCWKYKATYVWRPEVESGGKLWRTVYWQITFSAFTMVLAMTAIISFKKKTACAIFTGVMMPVVLIAAYIIDSSRKRPLQVISLQAATDLDVKESTAAATVPKELSPSETYVDPRMVFDEAGYQEFLAEATKWKRIFDSGAYNKEDFMTATEGVELDTVAVAQPKPSSEMLLSEPGPQPEMHGKDKNGAPDSYPPVGVASYPPPGVTDPNSNTRPVQQYPPAGVMDSNSNANPAQPKPADPPHV